MLTSWNIQLRSYFWGPRMEGRAHAARCKKLMKKIKEKAMIARVYNGDIGDGSNLGISYNLGPTIVRNGRV